MITMASMSDETNSIVHFLSILDLQLKTLQRTVHRECREKGELDHQRNEIDTLVGEIQDTRCQILELHYHQQQQPPQQPESLVVRPQHDHHPSSPEEMEHVLQVLQKSLQQQQGNDKKDRLIQAYKSRVQKDTTRIGQFKEAIQKLQLSRKEQATTIQQLNRQLQEEKENFLSSQTLKKQELLHTDRNDKLEEYMQDMELLLEGLADSEGDEIEHECLDNIHNEVVDSHVLSSSVETSQEQLQREQLCTIPVLPTAEDLGIQPNKSIQEEEEEEEGSERGDTMDYLPPSCTIPVVAECNDITSQKHHQSNHSINHKDLCLVLDDSLSVYSCNNNSITETTADSTLFTFDEQEQEIQELGRWTNKSLLKGSIIIPNEEADNSDQFSVFGDDITLSSSLSFDSSNRNFVSPECIIHRCAEQGTPIQRKKRTTMATTTPSSSKKLGSKEKFSLFRMYPTSLPRLRIHKGTKKSVGRDLMMEGEGISSRRCFP